MVSRRRFLYALGAMGALGPMAPLSRVMAADDLSQLHKRAETQFRMGTFLSITAYHESKTVLDEAIGAAFNTAAKAEGLFTRYETQSPLGVLNSQGVLKDTPSNVTNLLKRSLVLTQKTNRGFNPAVAPVLHILAKNNVGSLTELPRSLQADLKRLSNPEHVVMKGRTVRLASTEASISLDGIAKGHVVDIVAEELEQQGVHNFLVNAGGDIRIGSSVTVNQEWNIGIQNASSPAENLYTIPLRHRAMATSGNYESLASKGYNHIVPMTSQKLSSNTPECTAVSVMAPTCTEADSLATALFAMGVERGTRFINRHPAYACLWQTSNGSITSTNWSYTG
ncbi:FAD:protein FMN transferase [Halodesulfovibrio marinisediminis]|uniref:FAD:protein FMN transferase n=1 Tax=Halodesulfovibrio marinisediminis DSM 17456 TaxID=1121457 RepID=A0A1N6E9J1_9BACT|nr:FAD:protein FMN transferase [Halodesulfovibrio marinisediminis]SIN79666.1 thiamine biosynthesis lipoprotein [Halodesulfovibrio marinisediminis DSM 17456]